MSRAAARAITASWWAPRTDWTCFMRRANRRAFLPSFLPSAGRDGLRRVPGALRGLPRLMQRHVAFLPGCRPAGPVHPAACPMVGAPDGMREHLARGLGRRGSQRRAVEQPSELGPQAAGTARSRAHRAPPCGCSASSGAKCTLTRACAGPSTSSVGTAASPACRWLGEHFGVAGVAEYAAEPLQLRAQELGVRLGHDAGERLQRAAQPPHRDAHLVHGIRLVAADRQVKEAEPGRLSVEVGEHHLAGRRVPGEPPRWRRGQHTARGRVRCITWPRGASLGWYGRFLCLCGHRGRLPVVCPVTHAGSVG